MAPIRELIHSIASEAKQWRRQLHQNPQTMFEEQFASDFVAQKLTEWGITHERGVAGTGLVATIPGHRSSGRTVAFRADMDALDLVEQSGQPWASQSPGKMHGCGHDGHIVTLLTLGKYLQQTRNFDGTVRLIFQPAEEGGRGADRMLAEGLLDRFPFDEIYGYHNWPGLAKGLFAIRPGPMLAAVDFFEIHLSGKGGHAAMPHATIDVVPAICQLVLSLQTLISRETDPMASAVLSVTNVNAGSGAANVISGTASLTGTVRTFSPEIRRKIEERMRICAENTAAAFGATASVVYKYITDAVINDEQATQYCREAAGQVIPLEPIMGGEDFGSFLTVRPGAFIAIGQAEEDPASPHNFGLHSPFYDFNDAIIPIAANYFAELAERRLPVNAATSA